MVEPLDVFRNERGRRNRDVEYIGEHDLPAVRMPTCDEIDPEGNRLIDVVGFMAEEKVRYRRIETAACRTETCRERNLRPDIVDPDEGEGSVVDLDDLMRITEHAHPRAL